MATVVVLGAGLAGWSAAARLARNRHDVTVLDPVGSRADGADRAPARELGRLAQPPDDLVSTTVPAVYRDLFRSTGRPIADDLLVPLEPARRFVLPDGRALDLPTGSRAALLEAVGGLAGRAAAEQWDRLVAWGGDLWARTRPQLVPPGEAAAPSGPNLRRPRVTDPVLRQVLAWYAAEAGADPRLPELAMLPYLEQAFGSWRLDGGVRRLTQAVAERASSRGANHAVVSGVVGLVTSSGRVTGVRLPDGRTALADLVVDTLGFAAVEPASSRSLADRPKPAGQLVLVAQVTCTEPPDLPAETVVLTQRPGDTITVRRPDGPTSRRVVVRARPTESTALLGALATAGVQLPGATVDQVHVASRPAARGHRWRPVPRPDWLSLRAQLEDPSVGGLLHAHAMPGGGFAVPWQAMAAAVAAAACGAEPRGRERTASRE